MKKILVVDDEENIGRSLKLILEREGYSVALATSIEEARARSDRPDLYLIDVRLPDGSGIDLVRWLKSKEVTAPIVMISGHGTIADARITPMLVPALMNPYAKARSRRGNHSATAFAAAGNAGDSATPSSARMIRNPVKPRANA